MDLLQVRAVVFGLLLILQRRNFTGGRTDYVSGPYSAKFPAQQTSAAFIITIIDDDVVETAETFKLNIATLLPFNVVTPGEAIVTIVDNDRELQYNAVYF